MQKTVIKPSDIQVKHHYFDTFGNTETEISARWIVKFCQQHGNSWRSFTKRQLNKFYHKERGMVERFWFNQLENDKYLTFNKDKNGRTWIKVTPLFASICYTSNFR